MVCVLSLQSCGWAQPGLNWLLRNMSLNLNNIQKYVKIITQQQQRNQHWLILLHDEFHRDTMRFLDLILCMSCSRAEAYWSHLHFLFPQTLATSILFSVSMSLTTIATSYISEIMQHLFFCN